MGQGIKTNQPQPVTHIKEEGGIEKVGFTEESNVEIRSEKHTVYGSPPLADIPVQEGECLKGDLGGGQ